MKKPWSIDFLREKKSRLPVKVKRSKYAPDAPQVTYRHAAGYKRMGNGQLVCVADKMRDIPGRQRKKARSVLRQEEELLEIEKGLE